MITYFGAVQIPDKIIYLTYAKNQAKTFNAAIGKELSFLAARCARLGSEAPIRGIAILAIG